MTSFLSYQIVPSVILALGIVCDLVENHTKFKLPKEIWPFLVGLFIFNFFVSTALFIID